VDDHLKSQGEQLVQHYNGAIEPYSALPPPRSPLNWHDSTLQTGSDAALSGSVNYQKA